MTKYYGYTLSKESSHITQPNIKISKIEKIDLNDFPICHQFRSNQKRTIQLHTQKSLTQTNDHAQWIFEVQDVVLFLCDHKKNQISYKSQDLYTQKLCEYWLKHIVLPIYFTMNQKYYFFHAGAVQIGNCGVGFTGDSHAGKSTLTDFFIKKGHALITDDKLPTFEKNDRFYTIGSHPFHRPYRATEELGNKVEKYVEDNVPLSHIYILCPVRSDQEISIKEIKGIEKFQELRYASEITLPIYKQNRFEYLSAFANSVRTFYIDVPRELERLEEVYQVILDHSQNLKE